MRATELLGCTVYDADGEVVGHVHDLRFEPRSGEPGWTGYRLTALACGDRVEILSTGAYVTTYASQKFNGFAPLEEHYI